MARAMKDSGIEWIGEIPEGWNIVKLCYITERIFLGKTPEYSDMSNSHLTLGQKNNQSCGIDLNGVKYSTDNHAKSCANSDYLKYGDILLNSLGTGSVGRVGYFDITEGEFLTDGHIIVIRPKSDICGKYAYYFLSTLRKKLEDDAVGSTNQAFLTIPKIYKISLPMTSINEQRRIVSFLDTECARIDAVIEQTRASIEEYKKLKQSLITQAVTKGIRPGRKMKDSAVEWIGEIPEEWTVRPLKSYIDILPGYAFSSDDFNVDQGIRLLRGINVAPGSIRWDDVVYWNKEITDQIKQFELKEGDLVIGLDRPWISDGTRAAFLHESDMPCLLLQRVCRIRPNKDTDIRFVYHTIVGKSFEDALGTDTTGVSVPHISTKQIQQYLVAFPCKEEQMEISDYIDEKSANIDTLIQKKQQLLDELESYKKSLIFEYVTGKKEVKHF